MKEFIIERDAHDQRFDRYLSKLLVNAKKTEIQKWIRKKTISVNQKKVEPDYRLQLHDSVKLFLPDDLIEALTKKEIKEAKEVDLDIIYEDEDILVLDKPVGLLVHPDKSEFKNTLSSRVQSYLKHLITPTFTPASVNRLDKNTGGLVLFCKNYHALKHYNELMRDKKIKKKYQCISHGKLTSAVSIEGYLLKNEENNRVSLFDHEVKDSKYVLTHITPIKTLPDYSLLDVELVTGRTHQIRASLSYIHHPILGDIKYGGKKYKDLNHQILVAYRLEAENHVFETKNQKLEATWKTLEKENCCL